MSGHALGAGAAGAFGPAPGKVGDMVAAALDRIRVRRAERPSSVFPAAGASDRELALLGRLVDRDETLRHARLTAASSAVRL